mgnify:FL=1|tara:strand:+ start:112 stop:504 length:393 start_codon:yes stop_codon:yes gene_type:complete
MSEVFNLEIISPEKTIMKSEVLQVSLPGFEGEMTILKDHISLITFLRPGIIEVEGNKTKEKFFAEDGTVEFNNNSLLILSSLILNLKDLKQDYTQKMLEQAKEDLSKNTFDDKEKYLLAYKINTLEKLKI